MERKKKRGGRYFWLLGRRGEERESLAEVRAMLEARLEYGHCNCKGRVSRQEETIATEGKERE